MGKRLHTLILVICLCITISACKDNKPQAKPTPNKSLKVGIIFADLNDPLNMGLKGHFEKIAKEEKLDLSIYDQKGNSLNLTEEAKKALEKKVKALIIQPVNGEIAPETVALIKTKDVKLIIVESLPKDLSIDAYIAPDYLRAGEIQAQHFIDLISKETKANVLILKGDPVDPKAIDITKGNLRVLENSKNIGEYEIIPCLLWDSSQAYLNTKNAFEKMEGNIHGIFANSSSLAVGALKFIDEQGLMEKVITLGVGADAKALEQIKNNKHDAEVDLMQELEAQYALKAAKDLINNDFWEYDQQVPNGLADVPARVLPVRIINDINLYLVKDRLKEETKGKQNKSEDEAKQKEPEDKKQEQDKKEGTESQTIIFVVKTKEGLKYELPIQGQIESIEIKEQNKEKEKKEEIKSEE